MNTIQTFIQSEKFIFFFLLSVFLASAFLGQQVTTMYLYLVLGSVLISHTAKG